jgi:N-acetylneuraminic acid mutarotase
MKSLVSLIGIFSLLFLLVSGCKIKEQEEEPPVSDTPPSLSITSPQLQEDETLCGVVEITADAQGADGKQIARVEFYLDDQLLPGGTDTTPPYSADWDTAAVQVTAHTIKVIAYDSEDYSAEVSLGVNVWCGVKKTPMPTQRYYFSSNAVNGKIYVIGGYNPAANSSSVDSAAEVEPVFNVVEEYDPAVDQWTAKTPMPGTGRAAHGSCVIDGKIYIFGGDRGHEWVPGVEEYDPKTDSWAAKTPIPQDEGLGIGMLTCSAVNGKAYTFGGLGAENGTAVGEYNPVRDKWKVKAPMPRARYSCTGSAVAGKIYLMGGCPERASYNCANPIALVDVYEPSGDYWTTMPALMPTPRFALSSGVLAGKIFTFGGVNEQPDGLPTIDEYDYSTDQWTPRLPMPTGQREFGISVVSGKIYIIGSKVYEYTPQMP